ncbi:mucin-4-like isoform X2 [Haliotis rubra]|uniref:mucin-4-like isoform X2 n=1 Tax=Haliotis rubra TaxID=36100 RepID=UPI001EE53EB2|nr:mucin-4-like isoform X2 [Haliotis rubra]
MAQTNPSSDITSSSSTAAMSTQAPTVTSSSIDTTNTQTVTSPSNTRSSSDVSTTPSTQVSTIISTIPTSTADVDTHTSSGADTSLSPSPTSAVATASPSALPPQSTSSVITSTSVPSCAGAASNLQMTQRPTLTYSSSMTKVTFSCRVQKVADTGVTYTVKWVVGSTILKTDELNDRFYAQLDSSSLSNEERNNVLAKGIGCNATASISNCQSSELTSEQYYHFQFKVTTPGSMQLIEGLSVDIGVDMGIRPDMYCPLMYGEACSVYAEAAVVAMNSRKCVGSQRTIDPLVIKSAGFSVENAVCGARMSVTTASISLHSVLDRISHAQDTNVTVNIYQRDRVGSRDNITLIKALEITIIDRDMENALCGATADPHLTTFDLLHYDVMLEGEFIMYRHTELETEVRIYMRRVGLGSGVCGTSIRSGNDVIQINKCDIVPTNTTEKLPLKVKQYFRKSLTPRTKIYQEEEGNTYRILLPCGSKVTVSTLADIFMNVWVEPSAWVIGRSHKVSVAYMMVTKRMT